MIQVENKPKRKKGIYHDQRYILVGSKHKGEYVLKEKIVYIEAYENYSWIHLYNGSKHLSCKSIGYYQKQLIEDHFIRIHRSFLINSSHLRLYEPKYRLVHLRNELVLPVSFRRNRILFKQIENQESQLSFKIAV